MLGAIIGDIVGSAYEFNPTNDYNFEMFTAGSKFTDDTICTIAIADALLKGRDYGESLHDWCRRYMSPKGGFGGRFRKWVESTNPQPYGSFGNGSAMRVSPIGMWFSNDMAKVEEEARKSAACTHNHREGIKGAQATVESICWAIKECDGLLSDKKIGNLVTEFMTNLLYNYNYDANTDYEKYRNKFDETCQGTIPPALDILRKSTSFEDAIRTAVSLGADADTLGAIVGSVAEHIWGIPENMKEKAMSYLTDEMRAVVKEFYEKCEAREDYKPEQKTIDRIKSMMLWRLGCGHMGKFLNLENPMPSKKVKATSKNWKTLPMPTNDTSTIKLHFEIPEEKMRILKQGHIPEAQEDHWFMYCNENDIRYFRSWTGECSFEAHYYKIGEIYIIDSLTINHSLNNFGVNGDMTAKALFFYLIYSDIEGVNHRAWMAFIHEWEEQYKKNIDTADEEKRKAKEEEEKKKKADAERKMREERSRQRRIDKELLIKSLTANAHPYMTCIVAGTQFIEDQRIFYQFGINDILTLEYESNNKYDSNAVAIYFKEHKIGYIPRTQNAEIARLLKAGWKSAFLTYVSNWKGCDEKRQITIEIFITNYVEMPHYPFEENYTYTSYREAERKQLYCSTGGNTGTLPDRQTPARIDNLTSNEIFVFGSNAKGHHGGGAARFAMNHFGAVWGQGDGLQGHSYAISTMEGLIQTARNINRFIDFAALHPYTTFYVTPIGCGIAGYTPLQIAPLFRKALTLSNVYLPKSFWEYFWITEEIRPDFFTPDSNWMKWDK